LRERYCCWGDVNIDTIMLHPNSTDVAARVNDLTIKDLPFDGMFSQLGPFYNWVFVVVVVVVVRAPPLPNHHHQLAGFCCPVLLTYIQVIASAR
jgi:hypothetical protein